MILCFGEISWDRLLLVNKMPEEGNQVFVIKSSELPGGCTLNTAVHLAMMGEAVILGGNEIGGDQCGIKIKEIMENIGINFISRQWQNKITPRCDVLIDAETRDRSFLLHHEGIQDFHPNMFSGINLDKIDVAFVDTYLKDASYALLELLRIRPIKIWLQDLKSDDPRVALGDVVQISLDESCWSDCEKIKSIASGYFRGRCTTFVATVGKYGAFLLKSDGLFLYERDPSALPRDGLDSSQNDKRSHPRQGSRHPEQNEWPPVVDTTGCGDAFRAGAIVAWHGNKSWREILISGISRGSFQATIFGSNPINTLGLAQQ